MEPARLAQAVFERGGVRGSTTVSGANAFDVLTLFSLMNVRGSESMGET